MSLEADAVWKGGLWAPTVWATGVWAEGGSQITKWGKRPRRQFDEKEIQSIVAIALKALRNQPQTSG